MGIFSDIRDAENSSDVVDTIVEYAKQETIGPLKGAGKWLIVGSIAAVMVSIGMSLTLIGSLRLLRDVTGNAFDGGWSFAPYLIICVVSVVVIGLVLSRVKRRNL